ncbi:MAG: SPOR domain-containing protein [Burkholderiales bacterium]
MAEPDDSTLDELKRRGRRRLVGAVVLALVAAVVVPMLLESEPRPLGEDVSVRIPPVDDARPANKLGAAKGRTEPPRPEVSADGKGVAAKPDAGVATPPADGPGVAPPPAATPSTLANPVTTPAAATPAPTAPEPSSAPRKSLPDAEKSVLAPGTRPVPLEPSKAALDAPRSESTPAGSTVTKSAAGPPPSAAPKAPAAATPAPKAAPAPAATTPKEGYVVQLGAFTDDKGANALANRLKKAGYVAYTEALATSRGSMWRVRVGPFPTRDAATQARDRLKAEGQAGIVVQAR